MQTAADHPERTTRLPAEASFERGEQPAVSIMPIVLAFLLLLTVTLPAAHAQRAVIIVDGERIEIEFDEVDVLREQLNLQLRNQPGNVRQQQFDQVADADLEIPGDEELSRVSVDPELLSAVADLNSDSYATRELATERLLDVPHENIEFYALLARQELTTEQRSRLLMIVRQRLIQAPRGAVGISMMPHHGRDGRVQIEVTDIIEGLPAERVLEVGDRITHLNGRPLDSPDQLTVRVQSRRPGEQVMLTLLRPRRNEHGRPLKGVDDVIHDELHIELTLGSMEVLERAGGNVRVRHSGVEQLRRQKAKAVMERFSPRHAEIDIDSSLSSIYQLDERDRQTQRIIATRVEEHPAIMQIREHLRMLEENGIKPPGVLLAQWAETETRLQSQLEHAELSNELRIILRAVLERYRELMIE